MKTSTSKRVKWMAHCISYDPDWLLIPTISYYNIKPRAEVPGQWSIAFRWFGLSVGFGQIYWRENHPAVKKYLTIQT